jgi:hypothetical protein
VKAHPNLDAHGIGRRATSLILISLPAIVASDFPSLLDVSRNRNEMKLITRVHLVAMSRKHGKWIAVASHSNHGLLLKVLLNGKVKLSLCLVT